MQKLLSLNKRIFAILILVFNINIAYPQVNLVQNHDFELISSCPNDGSQIDSAIGWSIFKNGGGSTPDLYALCCTNPQMCGVPSHSSGFQFPKSGNNYIGIIAAGSILPNFFREYVQSKLIQKLKSGEEYCVKIYCNLSDFSTAYIKSLGVYLDSGNISTTSPYGLPTVSPQIYSQQPLNDTINWMKIEGSFIAIGIEEYISIGNFFPDSLSGIGYYGSQSNWFTYYYIDDVSVIPTNFLAYAGNDTLIQPGDSVFIGRQPEIGLDEDCIWFVNGVPIDTVAGMWVKPDSTTTYIVQQTICGNVKWDTITVSVYGTGIDGRFNEAAFKVYPNPTTGDIGIKTDNELNGLDVVLYINDILGNIIIQESLIINDITKLSTNLHNGTYILTIVLQGNDDNKTYKAKIIVIK